MQTTRQGVTAGARVREGQTLVVLDARDLDAAAGRARASREEVRNAIPEADSAVTAAKAHLDLVEVTYKRMKQLYEKKSISDQEFDEASAKLKAAQAELAMAQARRAQLDQRLASGGTGSSSGRSFAQLCRGQRARRRCRDREIGRSWKSGGSDDDRIGRLPARGFRRRIENTLDSRGTASLCCNRRNRAGFRSTRL